MAQVKKGFENINTEKADTGVSTGKVFEEIEKGKDSFQRQSDPSAEEIAERKSTLKTQGRKGCKLTRINLAFSPENYEYVSITSRVMGKTMTGFINWVLAQYREEHPDLYNEAKRVIDLANGNTADTANEE